MADSFPRTTSPGTDNASDSINFHTPRSTAFRERERPAPIEIPIQRRSSAAAYSATGTGAGNASPAEIPGNAENARNAGTTGNPDIARHTGNTRNDGNAANSSNFIRQPSQQNVDRPQAQNLNNNVPTMNDLYNLLQQSLQPRQRVNPQIIHHDLEYVIPNRGSHINIPRDCPEKLSDRRLWLKTVEVLFENSQSGIRWIETNTILACKESPQAQNIFTSDFNFDVVIPLSYIFRIIDGNIFIEQSDTRGMKFFIQLADRVVHEISRKIYALLLSRIPEPLQHLLESVQSYDGMALIKCLRSQTDNIHQTLVESLRDRKAALSLKSLADWPTTKSDLVSLFKDWRQAVADGVIDVGDSLTESSFKHLVADVCDAELPGTYEWVHNLDNKGKSWRDCLDHCDMLCRAQAKRLLSKRQAESMGLLADCDSESSTETDDSGAGVYSHYRYQRRYTPPPRELQRYPHAGRGAGRVRDTWRGGWSGQVRGRGSARGRGRGRSSRVAYPSRADGGTHSGKRQSKKGKLMTFDEWMEAFRSFQESQSSHTHASITDTTTHTSTSTNDTHTMPPPDTVVSDMHADAHDGDDEMEQRHVADVDEERFQ